MAISCRKNSEEMLQALVFAHNSMQASVATDGYHRDLTQITSCPLSDQSAIVVTTVLDMSKRRIALLELST